MEEKKEQTSLHPDNATYTELQQPVTPTTPATPQRESVRIKIDRVGSESPLSANINKSAKATLHALSNSAEIEKDFLNRQSPLVTGRAYLKSAQTIVYPEEEELYISEVTDSNKRFGVVEVGKQISSYNATLLNSPLKICSCFPGSFCYYLYHQRSLIFEELLYTLVFFGIVFWTALNKYNIIPKVIIETNSLGTLVAFFLGLYVSVSVARWWRLRTDGIGNIWSGTSGMATLLGPTYEMYRDNLFRNKNINDDERVNTLKRILIHLKKIQRYTQASLALVFSKYKQEGFGKRELVKRGIMTQDEYDHLFGNKESKDDNNNNNNNNNKSHDGHPHGIPGSHPEYMWSLVSREIMILRNECPTFMDEPLSRSIFEQIVKGRSGAGLIGAQMGAQLPLTYAHGVTLMAKMYNMIMAITSGIEFVNIWVQDLKDANPAKYEGLTNSEIIDEASIFFTWNVIVSCLALLVKTTSISLLLVLCQKLANPFDNDIMAYPGLKYVKWIYLDFEILLGFGIKQQWRKLGHTSYYKEIIDRKDTQRTKIDELAGECGLIDDENNNNFTFALP